MSKVNVSVNSFITALGNGLAKPNRFLVEFKLPKGIAESKLSVDSDALAGNIVSKDKEINTVIGDSGTGAINIFCHTCSLPQRSLLTYLHKQVSSPYRVPYSVQEYDPISFSFYADKDMKTRRYFDIWQNAVINIQPNTLNFWNEFTSNVTISMIDEEGNSTYSIVLYECFPISVGMIDLSYSASNILLSPIVTMTYRYWIDKDSKISKYTGFSDL